MAQVFADVIIQNTGSCQRRSLLGQCRDELIKALILYVDQGSPPEAKNIGQVYKLRTTSSEKERTASFDLLPGPSHPAKVPYCIYKQASDNARFWCYHRTGSRLQVFQNKLIRQITSYDDQPDAARKRKMCILLHYFGSGQHFRFFIFPVYDLHIYQTGPLCRHLWGRWKTACCCTYTG